MKNFLGRLRSLASSMSLFMSLLGIFITFYFGAMYVPSYVRTSIAGDRQHIAEKLANILIESTFDSSLCKQESINKLIGGASLEMTTDFKFSIDDIIKLAQWKIMGQTYLSINLRNRIFNRLDSLCINNEMVTDRTVGGMDASDAKLDNKRNALGSSNTLRVTFGYLLSLVAGLLILLMSALALWGLFSKSNNDHQIQDLSDNLEQFLTKLSISAGKEHDFKTAELAYLGACRLEVFSSDKDRIIAALGQLAYLGQQCDVEILKRFSEEHKIPEVREAAQQALSTWERLRSSNK